MAYIRITAALAMVGLVASTAPSFAYGGAAGCNVLPEHDRALGTVENGAYSCGMSMEEARAILARDSGETAPAQPGAPAPRKHHHHKTTPQM